MIFDDFEMIFDDSIESASRRRVSKRLDARASLTSVLHFSSRHQSSSVFASMFGTNKHEDAAELFERAAIRFKLAKLWSRAADSYDCLAECRAKTKETHEYASACVEAANMLRKCEKHESACARYRSAARAYAELGRFSQRGKHLKEVGETYESIGREEEAIEAYGEAASAYEGEESARTTRNACQLKRAALLAHRDRFEEATEIFEEVASASVDNNLLRFSVKGYFLQAGMCRLCWCDAVGVLNALERYDAADPAFPGSRERDVLEKCARAMEDGDGDAFSRAVAEFDSMSRLDAWKTTVLLKAKKRIEAAVREEEDDLT